MDALNIETGRDLISLIERGQTATFTKFYTSYFEKLVLASDKYLKDIHEAEEIVQDVFLKVWENPEYLSEVKSIKSYLYRTVINSSINYFNRQKNIEQHHLKLASELSDEYLINLDEENEMIVLLRSEIEKLPAQCKKVFKLSRFESLKYKEIANQLDISEKTVENHIGNALKILRERFLNDEQLNRQGKSYLMLMNLFLY
ncbi:RNA polymerase sigma-70 factor [Pedobacter sp. CCM 8938]|uniref:RNA polymerase sigma-70 factor n=2 Tax=Pedobacter fastidiosus TaxID=2765361 RepID=A0ABR7KLW2_9SPHI|nr:RNA polymerase sigma-70 factor [Pedobacter fastidiosus]MBC6109068.1 RNA polymerase sigma-70 factor [Pedobacter fastidiosus]